MLVQGKHLLIISLWIIFQGLYALPSINSNSQLTNAEFDKSAFIKALNITFANIAKDGMNADLSHLPKEFFTGFIPDLKTQLIQEIRPDLSPERDYEVCATCDLVFTIMHSFIMNEPYNALEDIAITACILSNMGSEEVCTGWVKSSGPELFYLAKNTDMDSGRFCGLYFTGSHCKESEQLNSWKVDMSFLPEKPDVASPTPPLASTFRILQLSDPHILPTYTVGSIANCEPPEWLCCRNATVISKSDVEFAYSGYWGDKHCDMPIWTFEDMLQDILDQHGTDFEYIYLTGDLPSHKFWGQSRTGNLETMRTTIYLIKKAFPGKKILFTMGNHDGFPADSFPMSSITDPDFQNSWLYDELAEMLQDFISAEALDTFRKDGYFSEKVSENLRVISINSNMGNIKNFWLNYEWKDAAGELAWLVEELSKAEEAKEKVHILSHILPKLTIPAWGRELNKIIVRFENTVTASFYGHTHRDSYFVYYDESNWKPASVAYVSPSAQTDDNPAYRLYTVNTATSHIVDIHTYIMNLDEANAAGPEVRPIYDLLYNTREEYQMESLFASDWHNLTLRMSQSDEILQTFKINYNKNQPEGYIPVTEEDRRAFICEVASTSNGDERLCDKILASL